MDYFKFPARARFAIFPRFGATQRTDQRHGANGQNWVTSQGVSFFHFCLSLRVKAALRAAALRIFVIAAFFPAALRLRVTAAFFAAALRSVGIRILRKKAGNYLT